jgi:hypothetical protein
MSDSTDLPPVPRPAQPVSPATSDDPWHLRGGQPGAGGAGPAPAPAFPPPSEFTIGAAPVPAPPAFAAPDPAYTATPAPYPFATAAPPVSGTPAYPAAAYPVTGYPVPAQPAYGGYGGYGAAPGGYYPAYAPQVKTNGMAIGSMVTAIVGAALLFCYGAGLPLGVVGAVLGHVSRRQIRDRGEGGDGMALAGIIVGWIVAGIGLVVVALVIWLFAWVATLPSPPEGPLD